MPDPCKLLKAEITTALGAVKTEAICLTGLSRTTLAAIHLGIAGGMPLEALVDMAFRERAERATNPKKPPMSRTRERASDLPKPASRKALRRRQRAARKERQAQAAVK